MKPDEQLLLHQVFINGGHLPEMQNITMNHKRLAYILEKWTEKKGWWDFGVSLRTGWLTVKGINKGLGIRTEWTHDLPTMTGMYHVAERLYQSSSHMPGVRKKTYIHVDTKVWVNANNVVFSVTEPWTREREYTRARPSVIYHPASSMVRVNSLPQYPDTFIWEE